MTSTPPHQPWSGAPGGKATGYRHQLEPGLTVEPPEFVPLDEARERAAIAALTELLADLVRRTNDAADT